MNVKPPQPLPPTSSSSSNSNSFPLTHTLYLHWASPPPSSSTAITTTSKSWRSFLVHTATNHTSPTDLSLTANSLDQTLLTLLCQRKIEDTWIATKEQWVVGNEEF
ncbi:hypothetical protein FH972_025411 [Carpinus fangiana]|uniref:Uncharacterized protein n=1 Tax=Carpinus fangiana TaxID=176857 RepID=A0A5N6L166_9ROSI|nr:hypothetical protein FH972_025411 [Carpinus fangiana]